MTSALDQIDDCDNTLNSQEKNKLQHLAHELHFNNALKETVKNDINHSLMWWVQGIISQHGFWYSQEDIWLFQLYCVLDGKQLQHYGIDGIWWKETEKSAQLITIDTSPLITSTHQNALPTLQINNSFSNKEKTVLEKLVSASQGDSSKKDIILEHINTISGGIDHLIAQWHKNTTTEVALVQAYCLIQWASLPRYGIDGGWWSETEKALQSLTNHAPNTEYKTPAYLTPKWLTVRWRDDFIDTVPKVAPLIKWFAQAEQSGSLDLTPHLWSSAIWPYGRLRGGHLKDFFNRLPEFRDLKKQFKESDNLYNLLKKWKNWNPWIALATVHAYEKAMMNLKVINGDPEKAAVFNLGWYNALNDMKENTRAWFLSSSPTPNNMSYGKYLHRFWTWMGNDAKAAEYTSYNV